MSTGMLIQKIGPLFGHSRLESFARKIPNSKWQELKAKEGTWSLLVNLIEK